MNLLFKVSGLLVESLVLSASVQAATLNGTLEGETLRWQNGQVSGSYLTLSNWQPVNGLQPTSEWIPGTFMTQPATEVDLQNSIGELVTVPIKVVGLDYGLGQAADKFPHRGNPTFSGPGLCTPPVEQTATTARAIGHSCIASESYQTSSSSVMYTPFQFARPVLEADSQQIAQAFRSKGVGSGQYTGTVNVRPAYYFKSPTGTWTYRQSLLVPVIVRIRYEAARLESLTVEGNGDMLPIYNTIDNTVSGSTSFRVTAKGYFTQGVQLSFDDVPYQMSLESDPQQKLPYSISCTACDESPIVTNGVLQLADGETVVGNNGLDEFQFDLRAHYDDVGPSEIETGQYRGQFTVYFEEAL
ncbi:hypothetical protein L4D09_22505 [Photobacterium makurazakiensis]|uniref:hypothetical protein n=1 Tax=Photobacterium TaxID=657 RepID=UPI003D0F33A0